MAATDGGGGGGAGWRTEFFTTAQNVINDRDVSSFTRLGLTTYNLAAYIPAADYPGLVALHFMVNLESENGFFDLGIRTDGSNSNTWTPVATCGTDSIIISLKSTTHYTSSVSWNLINGTPNFSVWCGWDLNATVIPEGKVSIHLMGYDMHV